MAPAVAARREGDTFQARIFWLHAARLLDPESGVSRVGFETGPKSFDDIRIVYDPARCPNDHYGRPVQREHIQCKWHVTQGSYGYADLVDPAFINATTRSFLQRARDARHKVVSEGIGVPEDVGIRFKLVSNWMLERTDPLRDLVSQRSGGIRLEKLCSPSTEKRRFGRVRQVWREHLDIDEDELRCLAQTLAFGHDPRSLDELRGDLDERFARVGLRRIPANQNAFPYDDLVFQWLAQGRRDFDRAGFRDACAREGLLRPAQGGRSVYGVKSFEHAFDRLEERCHAVLDLVPAFDARYIRQDDDWRSTLYPRLKTFLSDAARAEPRLRLALDAHTTLAFAAGSIIHVKAGREVELEQRVAGRQFWAADDQAPDPAWPTFATETVELRPDQPDIAVALGLTHDVAADMRAYVETSLPQVGRLLILRPTTRPGRQSVACGRHAAGLADAATDAVRAAKAGGSALVHLFIAAPNAFTFFLGQRRTALGTVRLYEFDFDGDGNRSYMPALTLPLPPAPSADDPASASSAMRR